MTIPEHHKLDFMKEYEGVEEKEYLLHSLMSGVRDLQIKLMKKGETVYYVCIQGLLQENSEDPKTWLNPGAYTAFSLSNKCMQRRQAKGKGV